MKSATRLLIVPEVKNEWNYTSSFFTCLHGVHRDKFVMRFLPSAQN